MNQYVFTVNSPINSYDILGLWAPPWCKNECPGDGYRNSFRVTGFVMGAISPTEQAGLDAALLLGELIGMMPTGLSRREMAEWLVQQGFPSGDLLSTYVQLILSRLPWDLYVVFEVDICKESTCCIFWEDRRYVRHSGVHRCTRGGNIGDGRWFPRSRLDQVPTRTLQECGDEALIEVLGGGGNVWPR